MATEVFNRQELKFVVTRQQYQAMLPTLLQYMRPDKHNQDGHTYRLYNLYIDTSDYALIRHSLNKPTIYKEKMRIRSYEPLRDDRMVFLEVKKRYKKITNKRRTKMALGDALRFVETGVVPERRAYMNRQVVDELAVMLRQHAYRPTVAITYDRMAFHAIDATSDLRMTFDANVMSRAYEGETQHQLLPHNKLIMEVKSCHNMPLWLVGMLDEQNIRKQSFSKYGTEFVRLLTEGKREERQYA